MKKIKRIIGPAMLLVATLATYTAVQRSTDIGQGGPLILADANTVAHVYWNGTALIDAKGNAWTANGSIPMVPKAGKIPAGAGPFSDANFYSLGTGNDVLDFAGDFSVCVVYRMPGAASGFIVSDGTTVDGWALRANSTTLVLPYIDGTIIGGAGVGPISLTEVNCACFGREGTTGRAKVNLGALATSTVGTVPGTLQSARIGRYSGDGQSFAGTIFEFWASTAPASDALFTAIMDRVKSRAGVTAW